jgi:hypothetical protein
MLYHVVVYSGWFDGYRGGPHRPTASCYILMSVARLQDTLSDCQQLTSEMLGLVVGTADDLHSMRV